MWKVIEDSKELSTRCSWFEGPHYLIIWDQRSKPKTIEFNYPKDVRILWRCYLHREQRGPNTPYYSLRGRGNLRYNWQHCCLRQTWFWLQRRRLWTVGILLWDNKVRQSNKVTKKYILTVYQIYISLEIPVQGNAETTWFGTRNIKNDVVDHLLARI